MLCACCEHHSCLPPLRLPPVSLFSRTMSQFSLAAMETHTCTGRGPGPPRAAGLRHVAHPSASPGCTLLCTCTAYAVMGAIWGCVWHSWQPATKPAAGMHGVQASRGLRIGLTPPAAAQGCNQALSRRPHLGGGKQHGCKGGDLQSGRQVGWQAGGPAGGVESVCGAA